MKRFIIPILLIANSLTSLCQKYDYNIIGGAYIPDDTTSTNFIVNFNTSPPNITEYKDSLIMGLDLLSISDFIGNLQYYSNGCIIRSKNNNNMEGLDFINYGPSDNTWTIHCGPNGLGDYPIFQGIFAIPFENGINEVFHIHVDPNPPTGPNIVCANDALLHTRLDMNANQGLGKGVFKDSVLATGCFQTPCANRHANGRDWWVLLPDNINHRFYRFISTPDGITGPWIQDIENPTQDTFFYQGWNEFSPDGNQLLINDANMGTAIYDFDRCTGLLSNLRHIPAVVDSYGYSACFSPDSRFIYVVRGNFTTIDQYDLQAPDLLGSRTTIATWDGYSDYFEPFGPPLPAQFSFFQHGPDGKLYNWAGGARFMHVMDFPNRKGFESGMRQRAISLPYYNFSANAYYPNYRLGPIDESGCDSLGINNQPMALFRYDIEDSLMPLAVTFTDLSYYEPTTWFWSFGDGATSQAVNPIHTYTQPNTYNVCLIVTNPFSADTFCQTIQVGVSAQENPVLQAQITVSPNPFIDRLSVSLSTQLRSPVFRLHDAVGRQVHEERITYGINPIKVPVLASGLYFYSIESGGAVVKTGKVVKR